MSDAPREDALPEGDPRDLTFQPVVNDNPRFLTREQIDHFNAHGFITGLDLFGPYQADDNRAYLDWLLQRTMDMGGSSYDVIGYHGRCQKLFDLCTNWLLLGMIEDLLGPDYLMWVSHAFAKMPGETRTVPWHQDASYWDITPSRTVTAWIAIDNVDVENGAMQYVAGSHLHGHLPFKARTPNAVLDQEVTDPTRLGPVRDVVLKAGQVALHTDLLVHGSGVNRSSRRRCGLTMRYSPTYVRPVRDDWNQDVILCRGEDRYGHWGAPIARPQGEEIVLPSYSFKAPEQDKVG